MSTLQSEIGDKINRLVDQLGCKLIGITLSILMYKKLKKKKKQ